jgi:uncharacterized membrane protein YdjX (TVP38/TMEM64 family)
MRPALRRGALAALLLSGIGAGFYYSRFLDIDEMLRMAGAYSEAAPIAFVAAYALATVLFVPGSALTLAGGALSLAERRVRQGRSAAWRHDGMERPWLRPS